MKNLAFSATSASSTASRTRSEPVGPPVLIKKKRRSNQVCTDIKDLQCLNNFNKIRMRDKN
jgi:hypothetical protein